MFNATNAREFVKEMERISNSARQKLRGNLTDGYYYVDEKEENVMKKYA